MQIYRIVGGAWNDTPFFQKGELFIPFMLSMLILQHKFSSDTRSRIPQTSTLKYDADIYVMINFWHICQLVSKELFCWNRHTLRKEHKKNHSLLRSRFGISSLFHKMFFCEKMEKSALFSLKVDYGSAHLNFN